VTVSLPVQRTVTDFAAFTGRTEAQELVEVRARVGGFLEEIKFKDGALVKQDDLLFVIDQRPFIAELNRARAQLDQAEAGITEAKAKLEEAKTLIAKADAGVTYNEKRYARAQEAASRNAVSRDELELNHAELLQSKADYEGSKAQKASAEAAIATAQAMAVAAGTAVKIAELNLEYTEVKAPISGRVSRTLVTRGNLVQAASQGEGTLLTTLVKVDPIYVYFDVDERTVLRVRNMIREGKAKSARDVELPVVLGLTNEEGYPHRGLIDFVDNRINPRTGTLRVRGVFDSEEGIITPGLFARVRVPIGQPHDALLVSERALDSDQGQKILYVVDNSNTVIVRRVETGAIHHGLRAIEQGLEPGDQVIVTGLQQVRPGMPVRPQVVAMPGLVEDAPLEMEPDVDPDVEPDPSAATTSSGSSLCQMDETWMAGVLYSKPSIPLPGFEYKTPGTQYKTPANQYKAPGTHL
jgi:RND family efflux transporter MFP subunit